MRDFDDDEWNRREREEWRRWDEQDVMMTTGNAHNGDAQAQNRLGYYYTVGHGPLEVDLTQAAYWYGKAAAQGHEEAIKTLSDLNAYVPVKEKADAGEADAQYQMGLWMSEGGNELVGLNYNAADWFIKAAEQGHEKAKEKLNEIIKTPNHWNSTILSMMTEKAEAADAQAQYEVGRYYTREEIFLPRPTHLENMAQAIKWFGMAAELGHKEAKEKHALLISLKTTHDKAIAGDADAQYQIGIWQSEGGNEMVCMDGLNATIWFGKAAAQNHREAKEKLDELNKNPRNWNSDKLISLISKANAGDAEAQYQLGLHSYEHSHSTGRYTEAIGWFKKAAEQGHVKAQEMLDNLKEKVNDTF
jgi:TPR repeat protein